MFNKDELNILDDFIKNRPQRLCKMCGINCRVVTTKKPCEELKKLAQTGDNNAIDFLSIFIPFNSLEEAKKVDEEVVNNIINNLKKDGNYDKNSITFYTCKYLGSDNKCTNYENRPLLCKIMPGNPWALVPPNCGFEGWLFQQREEKKQLVRAQKENILRLQTVLSSISNEEKKEQIKEYIQISQRIIDMYKQYGSEDW